MESFLLSGRVIGLVGLLCSVWVGLIWLIAWICLLYISVLCRLRVLLVWGIARVGLGLISVCWVGWVGMAGLRAWCHDAQRLYCLQQRYSSDGLQVTRQLIAATARLSPCIILSSAKCANTCTCLSGTASMKQRWPALGAVHADPVDIWHVGHQPGIPYDHQEEYTIFCTERRLQLTQARGKARDPT